MIQIIAAILSMAGSWMVYKKMGRQGWEGIVPIYNTYVLCQELYGNGWKFLLLLIPFYNIYFAIKMMIDLAKRSIWAQALASAFCCCRSCSG